ncbi:hypothetical protein CDAR_20001 [Caerostris darwini]|uniref:Uncharacterized protein n=1 Tax=Caerostris darwini TaxID=1538125 RepID=A0AAV4PZN4_9ARAC|nr:hypothetical protein CDAR_20001 [Caerostris darwini]
MPLTLLWIPAFHYALIGFLCSARETHNSIYHIEITSKSGTDQCMKQRLGWGQCHAIADSEAGLGFLQLNISEERRPLSLCIRSIQMLDWIPGGTFDFVLERDLGFRKRTS